MTDRRRNHQEAGGAALVTVLAATLVLTGCAAMLAGVGDLALTAARARTAADAAALAAAGTSPLVSRSGEDPRRAAEQASAANGARLTAVETAAWPLGYGVTVEARPSTRWVRRVVGPLRAGATAAVRPSTPAPITPAVLHR